MKITILSASAQAPTELSAFDKALCKMGVGNANLLHLSSVIPKGFSIERSEKPYPFDNSLQGDRLYVVYAEKRTNKPGRTVAAGIGWVTTTGSDEQWGLFVEHTAECQNEVEYQISQSLTSMTKDRPQYKWGKIQMKTANVKCIDEPVCAIAMAVYKSESW